ncbi:MAG TPA: hypothetical protein VLE43_15390 [Candidatus Saccharimonadia bacterium]|nr:hypothetical protein [Candidatus Saccharimonadia bacterium]
MKRTPRLLFLLLLALASGPAMGSEESFVPWQSVVIKADGTPETGTIRVEASTGEQGLASLRIHAFGREETVGKADLEKLRGYPLASIVITHEPGYESIGGHTVNVRLKRTQYNEAKELKTEVMVISLPKNAALRVMKMPDTAAP